MRNLLTILTLVIVVTFSSCTSTATLITKSSNGQQDTTIVSGTNGTDVISAANAIVAVKTGRFAPDGYNNVRVYYSNYTNTHQNMSSGTTSVRTHVGTLYGYKIWWDGNRYSMEGTSAKRTKLRRLLAYHPKINFPGGAKDYNDILKDIKVTPGVDWTPK